MSSERRAVKRKLTPRATVSGALLPAGYAAFLAGIKQRVRAARVRASLAANEEMISLYWDIGSAIHQKQVKHGWGTKIIDRLACDLQREFAKIEGFSRANLYRMRAFFLAWSDE